MSASTLPPPSLFRFGPLQIAYDGDLIRPRAWTIEQSRWAIELHDAGLPDGEILELCAGVGHIGLVAARETGRRIVQVDDNDDACGFARLNATAANVTSDVRCARMCVALRPDERFPLILADPPYVPSDQVEDHPDDPGHAIDGGPDGLDLARTCLDVAAAHLAPGGAVLLQLGGAHQARALCDHAHQRGLTCIETREYAPDRALLLLR
ncbi:MAG TPA: class I SAM-dependent methyltransferase [Acidimicrobiales bacterium]|nr:class I SAM-dependent methyltransferase [Acidimicrobiales bacterium]